MVVSHGESCPSSQEMVKKLKCSLGFTPAAVAPPDTINPEQVLYHHRAQRRCGKGGPARFPPSCTSALHSYHSKRNSTEYKNDKIPFARKEWKVKFSGYFLPFFFPMIPEKNPPEPLLFPSSSASFT